MGPKINASERTAEMPKLLDNEDKQGPLGMDNTPCLADDLQILVIEWYSPVSRHSADSLCTWRILTEDTQFRPGGPGLVVLNT